MLPSSAHTAESHHAGSSGLGAFQEMSKVSLWPSAPRRRGVRSEARRLRFHDGDEQAPPSPSCQDSVLGPRKETRFPEPPFPSVSTLRDIAFLSAGPAQRALPKRPAATFFPSKHVGKEPAAAAWGKEGG